MLKKVFYIVLMLFTIKVAAQEPQVKDSITTKDLTTFLKGQVIDFASKKPLSGAHLFNLNSVIGTISNDEGRFQLVAKPNDTVYISYLGFQSIKLKITRDLMKDNEFVIELHEKTEEMKEVVVKSHKLIGVLEIDVRNVPRDKYARIHIDGLPQTYEVGVKAPRKEFNTGIDALFRPIDFVYNMFGKKPKQQKKLKKLRDDEEIRKILENSFNRELMMEYLELDSAELMELLNECNYSDYFIKTASDLQLTEAILLCYENYKAIKKGSTIKDTNKQ